MAQVQEIVDLVLQALAANAKTIDDLTEVLNVGESDFIELNGGRKISVNKLAELVGGSMAEVTHAELKALRDGGALVAGKQYRITDYVCTTVQEDTQAADHQFDIIVTADDESTLNENARACINEQYEKSKTYLDDGDHCVFTGTQVKTKLITSDEVKELWFWKADGYTNEHAGYYTELTPREIEKLDEDDPFICVWAGNEAIFADDCVVFDKSEYETSNLLYFKTEDSYSFGYFSNSKLEAWKLKYTIDNDPERFVWADEENGKGVIYQMVDEWNNDCPYDFKNIMFKRTLTEGAYDESGDETWVYTFNGWDRDGEYCYDVTATPHDISEQTRQDAQDDGDSAEDGDLCHSNQIKAYYLYDNLGYYDRQQVLNNIVFLGVFFDDGYDDGWSSFECFSNTFSDNCYSNTFGNGCRSNTFSNFCSSNTFGGGCYSNTFGSGCSSNTFGNGCYSNTFGNDCHSNTFGNDCYQNAFSNNCHSNTFGNNYDYNIFGNGCQHNTFGKSCDYNTFGNYCNYNTFGNYCNSNTFGNECSYNTFGTSAGAKSYYQYITLESGVKYIYLNCTATTTSYVQNVHVNSGVEGISSSNRKTLTLATAKNAFLTTFGSANDVKIDV